jgi:hypothetical protein
LVEFLSEIDLKKFSDPKSVISILGVLQLKKASLSDVEKARAEKCLRELVSLPLSIFGVHKKDVEVLKQKAKSLLKEWADKRRQKLMKEQCIESTATSNSNSMSEPICITSDEEVKIVLDKKKPLSKSLNLSSKD